MIRKLRFDRFAAGVLALAGACTPLAPLPEDPHSHPASPHATEAPVAPRSTTLDEPATDQPPSHGRATHGEDVR